MTRQIKNAGGSDKLQANGTCPLCETVDVFTEKYQNYTLVIHHADMELKFLQRVLSLGGHNKRNIS